MLLDFKLLKLRSIVLRTSLIGRHSLWCPQVPF